MKLMILLIFASYSGQSALACQPPQSPLDHKPHEMAAVLTHPKVIAKFRDIGATRIASIGEEKKFYYLQGDKNCYVEATPTYTVAAPGMCPKLTDVAILDAACSVE